MYSGAIFVKEFLCSYFKENFKQEKISIKAPNDVMIDGKKVAGILIEKSFPFILMGIGVNIWSYPADCDQPVTCLIESLMLAKIDKSQFLLELSHQSTIQKLLSFCKLNLVKYALTR
jgi:biotin-(acetyl-CoA carboxylase) ligase